MRFAMTRLTTWAAVSAALALSAFALRPEVHTAYDRLRAAHESSTVRELAPAATHGVSTQALLLAERVIPRDAVYTVAVGRVPPLDAGTATAVTPIFEYWLLPRRYTPLIDDAQWIVTYHESSERLHVRIRREVGLGEDANAVEVAR